MLKILQCYSMVKILLLKTLRNNSINFPFKKYHRKWILLLQLPDPTLLTSKVRQSLLITWPPSLANAVYSLTYANRSIDRRLVSCVVYRSVTKTTWCCWCAIDDDQSRQNQIWRVEWRLVGRGIYKRPRRRWSVLSNEPCQRQVVQSSWSCSS